MWDYLIVAACTGSAGASLGVWVGWTVNGTLHGRLRARVALLQATSDLENRRVGVQSGREDLVRARAGRPARVSDGMASKPGVYERYLRVTSLTKEDGAERG